MVDKPSCSAEVIIIIGEADQNIQINERVYYKEMVGRDGKVKNREIDREVPFTDVWNR